MSISLWNEPVARISSFARRAMVSVVVIYEDIPARMRIQHTYWLLMRKLAREYEFECFWYGFEDLNNTRFALSARAAAARADLILFSVNAETEPPQPLKTWVESWIGSKAEQDAALAALLNETRRTRNRKFPVWKYLREIAERAGMSFVHEIIRSRRLRFNAT